jgi:large subunit ribosomal protein L10
LQAAQTVEQDYPEKKRRVLQQVSNLAEQYDVVVACGLHKVRAGQLMLLRKNFRGQMKILVAKNNLAKLALSKGNKVRGIGEFANKLEGQNVLIFTNLNPFKLYLIFERSKVNLPARAGDIVTEDILVPAGNTGIPPGPVLSEFKEAGVPTRIESGSIFITRDTVVARRGDVVSPKLAGTLARLNLKPIRAGLSISMALSDGLLYKAEDVRIDLNEYTARIKQAFANSVGLSVEAGYFTKESIPILLSKATRQAHSLALQSSYVTKESAPLILATAESRAQSLLAALKAKGYSG